MKTELNAYANTPHKTMVELVDLATKRTIAGENPDDVVQDLVDGYGLGWGSTNEQLISTAAKYGAKKDKPRRLNCACCGQYVMGRQWWNRDTGYGACPSCYQDEVKRSGEQYAISLYGKPGVHHSLEVTA